MTHQPFERFRVQLEPVTPIHVGSGTVVEPFEYVLHDDGRNQWLVVLDITRALAELSESDRASFLQIAAQAEFPRLRKWVREHVDVARYARWRVQVAQTPFDDLRRNQDDPKRLGEVQLFTRQGVKGQPFIPGSSIKGAVRTALVESAAGRADAAARTQLERVADTRRATDFEATALGYVDPRKGRPDLYRDPLRQLAFSDAVLPIDACFVDRPLVVKRPGARAAIEAGSDGIVFYEEVTWSKADGAQLAAIGECRRHSRFTSSQAGAHRLTPDWSVEDVCRACTEFYRAVLDWELNRFDGIVDLKVAQAIEDTATSLGPRQCLLRLGRHSHFEAMTVTEPFRKPPEKGHGATRTYLDGCIPMGWATLTFAEWV